VSGHAVLVDVSVPAAAAITGTAFDVFTNTGRAWLTPERIYAPSGRYGIQVVDVLPP
jgi:hypothetical protein